MCFKKHNDQVTETHCANPLNEEGLEMAAQPSEERSIVAAGSETQGANDKLTSKRGAAPGWQDLIDESSGDTYFYHESTGEVVWEARETWPEQPCGIGWVKDFDEASGNTYYFNECSGESVWDVEKTWEE